MKSTIVLSAVVALFLITTTSFTFSARPGQQSAKPQREIAITIDDLPANTAHRTRASWRQLTTKLLHGITGHKVPAIGFVNEVKLYEQDRPDEQAVALLRLWLEAGLELGNHSYSHPDLHNTPPEQFQADVLRGEVITKKLLKAKGREMRFFRHPFLHTGRSLAIKQDFENFLAKHGYHVAPVTIDNSEWIFARAYDNAFGRGNEAMMKRIGAAYIPYMESYLDFYEQQSRALFGREIKQILLLHANFLNADYFSELAQMMKQRGYQFIPLEQALTDKAYESPDIWTGSGGISWIHRWAITRKVDKSFFAGEPETPAFVQQEFENNSQ